MVSHDRRTNASPIAKVPAPGKGGKDNVLQSRTDESQGYLVKHKILPHDSGSGAATMFAEAASHPNSQNRRRIIGSSQETLGPGHRLDREARLAPYTDTSIRSTLTPGSE